MNERVFDILTVNKIPNDLSFYYWIYRTEAVRAAGRRFIKIWLFDRTGSGYKPDMITFSHDGNEYKVTEFSTVSEFNDSSIIGCYFETSAEDLSVDVKIISEGIRGVLQIAGGTEILYKKGSVLPENDYLIKKIPSYAEHHLVCPSIRENYWQCSCGRIHSSDETACVCGQNIYGIQGILNFDYTEAHVQDYLSEPIKFDLKKSFEENIQKYQEDFEKEYRIDRSCLQGRINLEAAEGNYRAEVRKKTSAKRKRLTITGIAAVLIAAVCAVFLFVPSYNAYAKGFGETDLQVKYKLYGELHVLNSQSIADKAYKDRILQLKRQGEWKKILDQFTKEYRYTSDIEKNERANLVFYDDEMFDIYNEARRKTK